MDISTFLRVELQTELTRIQKKNPLFSIRAFAKQLGLQSGTLSLILLGKRSISHRLGKKIIAQLEPSVAQRALVLLHQQTLRSKNSKKLKSLKIADDQSMLLKDWRHFAILSLMNTKSFQAEPKWMAERLGTKISECRHTWARLLRMGLVEKDAQGKWSAAFDRFHTDEDQVNLSLRHSHQEGLDLAKKVLANEELTRREFNWLVFAVQKEDIPILKLRVRAFREQIIKEFGRQCDADDVYRLNLQLFPYTQSYSKAEL